MTVQAADVAIVGGGIHGCSTAFHLANRGYSVILLEKDGLARHASGVNAGGVRSLLRDPAEIALSRASLSIWSRLRELIGDDGGFQASGQIAIAENDDDFRLLEKRRDALRAMGWEHEELIGCGELHAALPALAPHCIGGLVVRDDGFANPYRATTAFGKAAAANGAKIVIGCRATRVARRGSIWRVDTTAGPIDARILVNCAGAWANAIAGQLGEPVPLETVAPMMMVTSRVDAFLTPVVIGVGRKLSLKQMGNGTVVIGGGHLGRPDLERGATEIDFALLAHSAATVCELFPVIGKATIVRCWSGIESRLPDNIPVIGPSSTHGDAYHAFGYSLHGFQLGPIVGKLLAELIDTGHSSLSIAPFSITRFRSNASKVPFGSAAVPIHGSQEE